MTMLTTWPFDDMPMFGFDFIMADPNWRFETWSDAGKAAKSPENHYDTMSIDEIAALPVGQLAGRDCVLWLWGTHPMVLDSMGDAVRGLAPDASYSPVGHVIRSWGFRYVTSGVWVKRTRNGQLGFGTGYRLRSASEPFFIATNGSPETARTVRTVIEGPVRQHSRKPREAYIEAERMMPNARRADLFSREDRKGWTAWGHEVGKLNGVGDYDKLPKLPKTAKAELQPAPAPLLELL